VSTFPPSKLQLNSTHVPIKSPLPDNITLKSTFQKAPQNGCTGTETGSVSCSFPNQIGRRIPFPPASHQHFPSIRAHHGCDRPLSVLSQTAHPEQSPSSFLLPSFPYTFSNPRQALHAQRPKCRTDAFYSHVSCADC
jgi:hypothetical protein